MNTPQEILTPPDGAVSLPRHLRPREPRYKDCPFPEFLQSPKPLEIEIGCGKGKFIAARAEKSAAHNLLAIDKAGKYLKRRRTRAEKKGLNHLKFLVADVREILRDHVPAGRVRIFHVYFPDPWPKRRHRDRRLVTASFLKMLYERLEPSGLIYMATDDSDYFQAMRKAIDESACRWEVREARNERLTTDIELPMTSYENRFFSAGCDLYYLELKKI